MGSRHTLQRIWHPSCNLPGIWDPGHILQEYGVKPHCAKNIGFRLTLKSMWDLGSLLQEYGMQAHSAKNMGSRHTLQRIWDPGTLCQEYGI